MISHHETTNTAKSLWATSPNDFLLIDKLIKVLWDSPKPAPESIRRETIGNDLAALSSERFELIAAIIDSLHDRLLLKRDSERDSLIYLRAIYQLAESQEEQVKAALKEAQDWYMIASKDELKALALKH